MSKLSFRARALDPSKQMPIYLAEELPDLPEYSAINRAVPQMPSGMEKEEESEHHLQRAICTGLIIPTPEVYTTEQDFYDRNYPPNYRMPRQLIHMQPLGLEQDVPEYDMDSEDEFWINQQRKRLDLTPLKFEQMMDRLEKSSGQTVVTLNEAKALLKQDDEISIAVYDYWLNKRLKMQHPLILAVRTENRPGASSNNPYLAFRRRTEKMQTRKNRKNDETSYEKMLKLRRDLQRATTVLEMVKRREKTKREQLHLSIEIFEKRVQLRDYNGALLSELSATLKNSRPAFAPLYANQYSHHSSSSGATPTAVVPSVASSAAGLNNIIGSTGLLTPGAAGSVTTPGGHMYSSASQYLNSANMAMDALNTAGTRKEKRQYKKRKHKVPRDKQQQLHHQQQHLQQQQQYLANIGVIPTSATAVAALGAGVAGGVGGMGVPGTSTLPHHLPPHLHHHLHRQSSSPAPNESTIETEEEDLAHKIGSESEEEAPFAFRRKQGCDYLMSRSHTGNWAWESKEECGFGDTKYRYTLTSIRHPRPRCVGFARRRMGRGGRVLLDRVATNFDDFWSQLDYTIFDTTKPSSTTASVAACDTTTTANKKDSTTKPASPPTVVDLMPSATAASAAGALTSAAPTTVNNANTPAITIKQEVIETTHLVDHADIAADTDDNGLENGLNDRLEYEYSDDDEELEDENGIHVQRDRDYHSCISMARRRRRRRRQQLQQSENLKRRKINSPQSLQKSSDLAQRRLMYKLSQSIMDSGNIGRVNNLVNSSATTEQIKQEKVNGMNKDDGLVSSASLKSSVAPWPNHRCSPSAMDVNKANNSLYMHHITNSSSSYASSVVGIIHNNNNSSNNVNKNISNGSRSMNSCSISDKTNVIKPELVVQDPDFENASTSSCAPGDLQSRVIKQELIESTAPSTGSADDSNEPLISIQKLKTQMAPDIVEDEENVNLAQLSNLIKIKKEVYEDSMDRMETELLQLNGQRQQETNIKHAGDGDEVPCFNQMPDVIRQRNLRMQKCLPNTEALKGVNILIEDVGSVDDDELTMLGGLSPTSSQRLDICNELLSEIRRDWLHFRPKTPTETEKEDFWSLDTDYKLSSPLVEWSENTPIAVEIVRESVDGENCTRNLQATKSSIWKNEFDNCKSAFITPAFKYEDLEADTQLLQNAFIPDINRGSSKSPEVNNSAACLDLNFSGDSLNDINLLGDGDDADMLDNILQEVQIDDIKTLNQATNFWNGILDGENVDGDVEAAAGLLEGIDDATKKGDKSLGECKKTAKAKGGKKSCALLAPVGSSSFNCSALEGKRVKDEIFFKKEETKKEICDEETTDVAEVAIKIEPMDTTESKELLQPNNVLVNVPQQHHQLQPPAPLVLAASSSGCVNINSSSSQREVVQVGQPTPIVIAQSIPQQQPHLQQTQQMIAHHSTPSLQVIGNAITINHPNETITTQNQIQNVAPLANNPQQQPQPAQQLTTIQVLQPPTTQRIRNVTVQELHQLQQQQQRKLQQQKFLMQRDLANASSAAGGGASAVIAQYVPNSSNSTTIMRQPTLTPIGASSVNNSTGQMIYTTTSSGDVIATGSQKIYLQKAPVSLSSTTQGVNIINTSSGQQLTVQNIAGVQHINAAGNNSNSTGPLIVTTSARNAVQQLAQQHQQQQLVGQPTQQIVWRQIGSTNVTTTPAGMLSAATNADGTVTATTGAGNKIVWTNRPTQKRQLNGPDNTDINKLLLNRKFSQRKIITQQQAQPQILQQQQLQHQQQQQQHQPQDEDLTTVNAIGGQDTTMTSTTGVTYATQQQHHQQHQQQPQIQKVAGGKVIKMPSFPLLVSEVNLQQQQQQQQQQLQQQKHNTAAAIAANHNYSLQPTAAILTSQASQQSGGGNKIYLTTSSSGGAATNFTITNASELQSAAQKLQQANNTNLKLNFLAATNASNQQPGGAVTMQQQQQTVVLNKATMQQQHLLSQQLLQQQGKLKRERILNIIGAATTIDGSNATGTVTATTVGGSSITGDNNKRVLYTSLLNVKQLQKNNAGQMQVQIGPQGMAHAVLRSRIGNNQPIFANMRTVPVASVAGHNNTGGLTGTTVQVVSSSQASVNLNSNTISASIGGGGGGNVMLNNSDVGNSQQMTSTLSTDMNNSVGLIVNSSSSSDLKSVSGMENSSLATSSPAVSTNNSSANGGGGNSSSNATNNNVTTINNTTTINR